MGNCFSPPKNNRPEIRNRRQGMIKQRSSLSDLNDSRHVMMRRSSSKGAKVQEDGSFYRPRQSFTINEMTNGSQVTQSTQEDSQNPREQTPSGSENRSGSNFKFVSRHRTESGPDCSVAIDP